MNFLNHFLTPFCLKWKKLPKNSTKMILIKFYTKFEQNATFHVFEKKSKNVTFFRFSKLKIDVWLKMSVLSKIMEIFFLEFFKSLSDAILLKMKKTSKKLDKNDPNQLLHKIWAKHDFSCFRKKVEKSHFFFGFRTSKSMSD